MVRLPLVPAALAAVAAVGALRRLIPEPESYTPADPTFQRYDHAVWRLSRDGHHCGWCACQVGWNSFGRGEHWLWFVEIGTDGSISHPIEDYGPSWFHVQELDDGCLEPQTTVLPQARLSAELLPPDDAAEVWSELGLTDDDF